MGFIISKFRKKSSAEKLESIEEEIKELEACSADIELRHKKITRQLLIYSSGLCIIFAILLYFYIPPKLQTKIILILLLLLSPLIYYLVNKIISWYYKRQITSSHSRLKDLKKEKKRLVDEIMDKETYKVAKEILEKYAPETFPQKPPPTYRAASPATLGTVRSSLPVGGPNAIVKSQAMPLLNQASRPSFNPRAQNPPRQGLLALPSAGMGQRMQPFNPGKGFVERFFEYLIGDGPNNRYALICNSCSTHNGMALQEEFEYTPFKCYSCFTFNPAKKQRPTAPKLESNKSEWDIAELDLNSSFSDDQNGVKVEEIEDDYEENDVEGEVDTTSTAGEVKKPDRSDGPFNREEDEDASAESSNTTFTISRPSTTFDDLNEKTVDSDGAVNGGADSGSEKEINND